MVDEVRYSFESRGLASGDKLTVVDFKGAEGISRPYEFTITLKSENPDIDFDTMLRARCELSLQLGSERNRFHGVLKNFDQLQQVGQYTLYEAVLVPRLWQLSLYRTNEVYLEQTVPDMIEAVLKECGLTELDYEFRLAEDYPEWEYRCEYDESHFDFISRIMERDGIYYFFEQGEEAEKIIFCDKRHKQSSLSDPDITFSPTTGLDLRQGSAVHSLVCRNQRMPNQVVLKDFNYEKPTLDVVGTASIDEAGLGEVYSYGDNIQAPEDGEALAQVRAEEIFCSKTRYHGEGIAVGLKSGYQFKLKNHFRASFNQQYLIVSIEHEGRDPSFLTREAGTQDAPMPGYYNSFEAIAAEVQYRPPRIATKQRIRGTIHALIDAEGDGQYAELDGQGRYKVILPFDRSRRQEGKASHWVRMASPFAGAREGMNFPLRKGTEVLLSFIDGDPDRPVIASAIANGANPNVVTGENQTNNIIRTSSGNLIEMEDQQGTNRIKFKTGDDKTYVHLGSPNHAGDGWVVMTTGIERKEVAGGRQVTWTTSSTDLTGTQTTNTGSDSGTAVDNRTETGTVSVTSTSDNAAHDHTLSYTNANVTSGIGTDSVKRYTWTQTAPTSGTLANLTINHATGSVWPPTQAAVVVEPANAGPAETLEFELSVEVIPGTVDERSLFTFHNMDLPTGTDTWRYEELSAAEEISGRYLVDRNKGQRFSWRNGGDTNFHLGPSLDVYDATTSQTWSNIQTNLLDDLYKRTGIASGKPGYAPASSSSKQYTKAYRGSPPRDNNNAAPAYKNWAEIIRDARVQLRAHDTVTAQKGNIYDFGGYWNYDLGNSYEEAHTDQGAELNKKHTKDWPPANVANIITSIISGGLAFLLPTITAAAIAKKMASPPKVATISAGLGIASILSVFLRGTLFRPGTRGLADGLQGTGLSNPFANFFDYGVDDLIGGADSFDEIKGKNITLDSAHAWVEKKIVPFDKTKKKYVGGSYSYSEQNSIEISIGDKEEHNRGNSTTYNYGGRHEEFNYTGEGVLRSWSSGSLRGATLGIVNSASVNFDPLTGMPTEFDLSMLIGKVSIKTPALPRVNYSVDCSTANVNISAGGGQNVNISTGARDDIDLEVTSNGLELKSEIADGKLRNKILAHVGSINNEIIKDAVGVEVKSKMDGIEASMEKFALKTELENTNQRLKTAVVGIEREQMKLENKMMELDSANVKLDTPYVIEIVG